MQTTWQTVAKGIPCWAGCLFFDGAGREHRCTDVTEPSSYRNEANVWTETMDYTACDCFPNLEDADTRAAYLRRLAIALGCPEDQADNGATCYYSNITDAWWIAAGDGVWGKRIAKERPDEKLAVLAEAWPADKRTT